MNTSFFNNNDGNNSFSGTQILSQQGGGYLNSSMMSDNAGGDNGTSGQNRMGTQYEASLLPCTIKQIQTAPLPAKDDGFRIDGKEIHNATIVGRIVHINVESTHTSYTIDDGTGQIDVRVWTTVSDNKNNDENDNSNDNSNDNNNNNNNSDDDSDFELNTYVRCIGKIKVYQENVNFNGYKMRKIKDHNEITYHNLETIFAHLVNTNPMQARSILSQNKTVNQSSNNNNNQQQQRQQQNRMNNSNSNSNSNSNHNGMGMMSSNHNNNNNNNSNSNNNNNNNGGNMMIEEEDNRERSPLEVAILQFLRRCEDENGQNNSYDGCHVDKILQAFDDNQRNDIRELLEYMSSDGTIYSTVDDEHFRTSQ